VLSGIGSSDRTEGVFGPPRIGRLARSAQSFGDAGCWLRPSYSQQGFGPGGMRVGSLDLFVAFGLRAGERTVRPSGAFGSLAGGSMSGSCRLRTATVRAERFVSTELRLRGERDVEMGSRGTNTTRGSAPETAYGHATGAKL
jgi:hypothetical protein